MARGDAPLIQGSPGIGKIHLAVALGCEAIRYGYSVLFTPATALVTTLVRDMRKESWSGAWPSSPNLSC